MALTQKIIGIHGSRQGLHRLAAGNAGHNRNAPQGHILPQGFDHPFRAPIRQRHTQNDDRDLPMLPDTGQRLLRTGSSENIILLSKRALYPITVGSILVHHQQRAGIVPIPYGHSVRQMPLGSPQGFHFLNRHGFGKVVTLYIVAARRHQTVDLFPVLYPFCHHAQLQPVGHRDNIFQNALVSGFGNFILNKLHIQLEDIQLHLAQHIQ